MQSVLFGCEQAELTSDDYYTPAWVFERMGLTFDLDVASPPAGIPWIPARRWLSKADDGLNQEWQGRVWMNPPFSEVTPWVNKFIEHCYGVCLLPHAKSKWHTRIWDTADGVTITDRFDFCGGRSNGEVRFPVFFAAFGAECVEAIGRLGRVR
jgi:hypothetical protein